MPEAVVTAEAVIVRTMRELSALRPVFYNEADFQHAFAWTIHTGDPDCAIRLEIPLPFGGRLDLMAVTQGVRLAVELKYPRAPFSTVVPGELFPYERKSADAVDDTRHAAISDLARLERLVAAGLADAGCLLVLTNNSDFWRMPAVPTTALDANLRIHEGAKLSGERNWGVGGREKPAILLTGSYDAAWKCYSELEAGAGAREFRYLAIMTPSVTA